MTDLIAQFVSPQMAGIFSLFIVFIVAIYILVVIWVARDAYQRGTLWWAWALIALIPIVGVIAYLLLRPSLYQVDRSEQELEIALKQRQLMKYGECANCGYPVEADFVICPNCHQRLKNLCTNCGHALDPSWTVCPYCGKPVGGQPRRAAGSNPRARRAAPQTRPEQDPSTQRVPTE